MDASLATGPVSQFRESEPVRRELRFAVPDITTAETDAATRALLSGWITTGAESAALEQELGAALGSRHVVAVSSCTAALEIAVAHLGLPRGARIGVPRWTFVSTALAAVHRGLVPVFLDADPDSLNLSVESLDAALDAGLDAVIAVHFGGVPVDGEVFNRCAARGVPVIEDAAHALGARDHRGPIGSNSPAGCAFSFYATKNLTCAEGGALATDDDALAEFARSFRLHGMSKDAWARYAPGRGAESHYDLTGDGLKANLPDVLAAVARVQLSRFDELQSQRLALATHYRRQLERLDSVEPLPACQRAHSANHLMVVRLPEDAPRPLVQEYLAAEGIGTSVHFQPLHTFGWFQRRGFEAGPSGTEVADSLAPRVLSLPLHTLMSADDVEWVCQSLSAAVDVARQQR